MSTEPKLLVVGLACVDILSYIDGFPREDSQQLVKELRWALGGNAANNAVVLSQLGSPAVLFAALGQDAVTWPIAKAHLEEAKVDYAPSLLRSGDAFSITTAIVNEANGSRTILHNRSDMNEPRFEEFKSLDLSCYSWIHFEGRNRSQVRLMIDHCRSLPHKPTVSVEVEKLYDGLEALIPGTDVVFLSKDLAMHHKLPNMESAVRHAAAKWADPGAHIICAWGELGATALDGKTGELCFAPVFSPPKVVDTLGAGDTFVAATLHALFAGSSLEKAIQTGCQVAGTKCGQRGLLNIPLPK